MPRKKTATPITLEHFAPQAEEQQGYSHILQGKATNALAHTSKRSMTANPVTGAGLATTDSVEVFIRNYNSIVLNVPTHKVMDALTLKLTSNFPHGKEATAESIDAHRAVELSVDEYMELCQLKDRKEARKQLSEATQALYDVSLEWDEVRYYVPEGKKKRVKDTFHWKTRIIDTTGADLDQDPVKRGKVAIKFSFDIAKYLSQAYIMPYPDKLLSISAKYNPHSYYIGRKLAEHHNMNIGKENASRISVRTLLEALPDLPSYDSIISTAGKNITQQIIQPFERDLIALRDTYGILTSWHYCNSKGEPLTDEQVESYSYSTWVQWLVEFELADYPDQRERLAKIEERKRIAASKRKRAAKSKTEETPTETEEKPA